MKKSMLILTIPALLGASLIFSACTSSTNKVDNAKKDVVEAKSDLKDAREDLQDANQEYLRDVEAYRREVSEKIAANNRSIVDFNTQIKNEKLEAQADYRRQLDDLDRRNEVMKRRLNDYKVNGQSNWESFKKEYNKDLDALGTAFRNMTVGTTRTSGK
jgi:chromosome segregation ATPase